MIGIAALPVAMFELSLAGGTIDHSFSGVCSGSLTDLSEKQLLNSGFTVSKDMVCFPVMSKSDMWQVSGSTVPVRISVLFQLPLYGHPEFRQPEKMVWRFPLQSALIVMAEFRILGTESFSVMDSSGSFDNLDSLALLNDRIDLFTYELDGKQYYFNFYRDPRSEFCEISTEIFYGKLFLMLKYYVCYVYDHLPADLTPKWYKSFVNLE